MNARYEVLTAELLKIQVFWDVTLCQLVVPDFSKDLQSWRSSMTT
jgi:hypothetical protein